MRASIALAPSWETPNAMSRICEGVGETGPALSKSRIERGNVSNSAISSPKQFSL